MNYQNERNPILPLKYHIPDSEAHVMPDGNLYIYGSFDNREDVFCSEEYHVVSTRDMKNWVVHEAALLGKDIPWFNNPNAPKFPGIDWNNPTPFIKKMIQKDIEDGVDLKAKFEEDKGKEKTALLFAPDCVEKDGKYYLYFCMSDDSEGVAVSNSPKGPFENPIQLPCGGIDPAIFIDDDGQAYYYWGQLYSHGVKLNPDMVTFNRDDIVDNLVTEEKDYFHEGSSMRKIGDKYYYIYADMERGKPTSLGYAIGKSPLGPFEYKGIIIDNDGCDPASWNNHGSIENIGGQWYVFYHRCSRGVQQHRRLCIEKIEVLEDGTIPEVKMTSQGIGNPFQTGEVIYGYQACQLSGSTFIDVNQDDSNRKRWEEVLTHISEGDTSTFRYISNENPWKGITIFSKGSATVKVLIDNNMAGVIQIDDDQENGKQYSINGLPGYKQELRLEFGAAKDFTLYQLYLE